MAAPRYRIHPAIGIARIGDAPAASFFLTPERPNDRPVPPFKVGGLIRRQAQRFRIYEYTESAGVWTVSREITADLPDVVELTWTVHLANRKAEFFTFNGLVGSPILGGAPAPVRRNHGVGDRRKLQIDPLPRSITPVNRTTGIAPGIPPAVEIKKGNSGTPASELWPSPAPTPPLEYLGELRTDPRGRLTVIGGAGVVAKQPGAPDIHHYANNDKWFDDVSDGPVTATLRLRTGGGAVTTVPVMGAWILVGPPDFAPGIPPVVTLWDLLVDLAVRKHPLPSDEAVFRPGGALARISAMSAQLRSGAATFTTHKPSFDEDVAPILRSAVLHAWTFAPLQSHHVNMGAGLWDFLSDPACPPSTRQTIFRRVRKPGTPGLTGTDMPRLLGDDPYNQFHTNRYGLTVTPTQYAILEAWCCGRFHKTTLLPASLLSPPVPPTITPHGLDQAALESCSGGAFFPGIEVGWQIRDVDFVEPFRVKCGGPTRYTSDAGTTVGAGFFSRQMALPWLADFLQCKQEEQIITHNPWGWWPSQRPDGVYPTAAAVAAGTMVPWHRATVGGSADWPSDATHGPPSRPPQMPSYPQMVDNWKKLAFVVRDPSGVYIECDRSITVP